MTSFALIDTQIQLNSDTAYVLTKVREVYNQCKVVQTQIARFGTDQAFSDTFDTIMFAGGFDGTAIISQMLYQIDQLVAAWEANNSWREALGLETI